MLKVSLALFVLALVVVGRANDAYAGTSPSMNCAIGPQERIFGKTKWLLYGCEGAKAAVLVSAEGNPALPFYFFVLRESNSYKISGEGTGDKLASGAALKDLKRLTPEALADLVRAASMPKR